MDGPLPTSPAPAGPREPAGGDLVQAIWAGPIPPPSVLAQHERIDPGAAERIFNAFERQIEYRHSLELRVVEADVRVGERDSGERRRGQYLAFSSCLAAIAGGTWTGLRGEQFAGSVIGGTGLAGLAAAFIYGRAASDAER